LLRKSHAGFCHVVPRATIRPACTEAGENTAEGVPRYVEAVSCGLTPSGGDEATIAADVALIRKLSVRQFGSELRLLGESCDSYRTRIRSRRCYCL
jgi:hypothetical protein